MQTTNGQPNNVERTAQADIYVANEKVDTETDFAFSWYSGLTSLFGGSEGRQHEDLSFEKGEVSARVDFGDHREDVDDESTAASTVSTLGKGICDDLHSLPSVKDSVAEGDESLVSFETNGNSQVEGMQSEPKAKKLPKSVSKMVNVEDVVERKISNLKMDGNDGDASSDRNNVPFLRRKMFPYSSGRDTSKSQLNSDPIVETRRQLLVRELRAAVDRYGRYDTRCANITAALGDLYDESREHKQAIRLHQDAISVYSAQLGDDHETTIAAKTRLGKVLQNAGEYDEAVSTLFNVLCMVKALKGEKDPASSYAMVHVAGALRQKGKYELAVKTLKRALKAYREALGDSHPSVSSTVDEIASLYVTMGDFSKASAILEEVVKLKAVTMGVGSEGVASSLSELATCHECAEQYSKAMKNLKKAYKIHADVSGESGEKAILTLERIALIYQVTGQFKKASIAYLGVLRGRKRTLGEFHPTVADTYFHLGVSLRDSGQQEKAFKCMKQSLNIYVGEGKDMHDVEMIAEVMHELAIMHKANNNTADAIKTFKQEIAVRRKLGQPEYPLISQTLNHLGVAELESRNHNKALAYFMEALTICEKKGRSSGTDFAEVLYNTGLVFESLRNKQRAYDAFVEAARVFKMNGYNESHPHLSKAASKLKRLGHTCQCRNRQCTSVPCVSVLEGRRVVGRR
jgi:tetratricopeptide (TPR) repeat protein